MKLLECKECGNTFEVDESKPGKILYCSKECRKRTESRRNAERYMLTKEENKKAEQPVKKMPRKKKKLTIGEISVMARQERLTYGQWVAKHEYGGRW